MDQNKFRLLNIFSLILVVILFVCFCMILLINPSFKIAMLCYLSEFEIGLFYFPKSHVPNPGGHNFILILTQSLHLGNQDRKACPKVMFFNLFSNLHVAHGPGCLRSVEVTGSPAPLVWLLWAASGCCHWSVEVLETKETSCNCRFSGLDVHRKQCQKIEWGLLVVRPGDQHRADLEPSGEEAEAQLVSCVREHRLWDA